ncbi:family 43 glycosylhydrolase [Ferruginibacter albus]|uniref:family 43 glycosylhydrolase n=1 Tax=Ferruginibacter albus TaxID=2875540 RepID=UPI001CC700D1|nr:family 43 glycosylhydrolase [Ferruginibacter albus]UAY50841.1 family 43 glycosylhydrolase [Ferruginibacter albus]
MNKSRSIFVAFILIVLVSCSKSSTTGTPPPPPTDTTTTVDTSNYAAWRYFDANHKNPFITDMYTADPSAHVWADGRLYVYASHDIPPAYGCNWMDKYHVFSTDDMVHWTDHGQVLEASQVNTLQYPGTSEGSFMWAPDCAYKNGTYYLYFPHAVDSPWNTNWKIGVATSSEPAANFTFQKYIDGLESLIDPCIFVDDDGQAYLYYGGGGTCKGGKLKSNMMEIDGQMKSMDGLQDFHEATWVHKRNGMYYLSYANNYSNSNAHKGNQMAYAVSSSPLGPWQYRGVYIESTTSSTDHGSIVQFKGKWYAFYHNSAISNYDWLRSVCVDTLGYYDNGLIKKVIQTTGN